MRRGNTSNAGMCCGERWRCRPIGKRRPSSRQFGTVAILFNIATGEVRGMPICANVRLAGR